MKWLVSVSIGILLCLTSSIGSCQTTSEAVPSSTDTPSLPPTSPPHLPETPPIGLPQAAQTHDASQYQEILNFLTSQDLVPSTHTQQSSAPMTRAQLYPFLQRFLAAGKPAQPSTDTIKPSVETHTPSPASHTDSMDALLALETPKDATTAPAAGAPALIPPSPPKTDIPPVPQPSLSEPTTSTPPPALPLASASTLASTPTPATPPSPSVPTSTAQVPPSTPTITTLPLPPSLPEQTAPATEPTHPAKTPPVPLLGKHDLEYLRTLDMQRNALSKDKLLPESTKNTLSHVERTMLAQRSIDELSESDTMNIERGNLKKDMQATNALPPLRGSPTRLSVSDADAQPRKNSKQPALDRANKALVAGQISAAISLYKDILAADKKNPSALFGLATAYHRDHQYGEARTLYTQILAANPNHKEALNNFLLLAADEAPEDALLELKKLERINPQFSPVLAQIGMIYLKMHKPAEAEHYLRSALELSPGNTAYLYNLAITLDHEDKFQQAIPLYTQLLEAEKDGSDIPGSFAQIRERLAYLKTRIK